MKSSYQKEFKEECKEINADRKDEISRATVGPNEARPSALEMLIERNSEFAGCKGKERLTSGTRTYGEPTDKRRTTSAISI